MSIYLSEPGYSGLDVLVGGNPNPSLNILTLTDLNFNLSESVVRELKILTSINGTIRTIRRKQLKDPLNKVFNFEHLNKDKYIEVRDYFNTYQGSYLKLKEGAIERIFIVIETELVFQQLGTAAEKDDPHNLLYTLSVQTSILEL